MTKSGCEIVMLDQVVIPKIEEVKTLLQAGNLKDAIGIIGRDILGLLIPYRDAECKKYENIPENLKSAPNSVRIKDTINTYEEIIQLLYDESKGRLYFITEQDLDHVASKLSGLIES